MAENESDYCIVMECSGKNKGYKRTKIILTMGGCMQKDGMSLSEHIKGGVFKTYTQQSCVSETHDCFMF